MNPALAPGMTKPGELQTVHLAMQTLGNGPRRVYQDIAISAVALEFPPRPAHGSIADFDVIMNHCDYDKHQVSIERPSTYPRWLISVYFSMFATV